MSTEPQKKLVANSFEIDMDVHIRASRHVVFVMLTMEIDRWWSFRVIELLFPASMVLEPRVGGRFYEDAGEGMGALWGIVWDYVPSKALCLSGPLGMRTPVNNVCQFVLEASGEETAVKLSHRAIGLLEEGTHDRYQRAWRELLDSLKAHCEARSTI
jgi:hypothetical protein